MFKSKFKAFTLVELIVVIVILAILATIAFLSFNTYSSGARDSTRLSDIANIAKGLTVQYTIGGKYLIPDNSVNLTLSGTIIGYQGNAGSNTLSTIKISNNGGKDPINNTYYTYSINLNQNKYQILGFLENKLTTSFNDIFKGKLINQLNAINYINRYPYEKGDTLGIILAQTGVITSTSNNITYTPIQDTNTGIELNNTNTGIVAFIDSNTALGSSGSLNGISANYICSTGNDSYTKLLLHFDGINNSKTFTDSSLSSKILTSFGDAKISNMQSKFGGFSSYFDGTGDYLIMSDSLDLDLSSGDFTIDFWVNFSAREPSGFNTFLWKGDGGGYPGSSYQLDYKNATNELRFVSYGGAANHSTQSWTASLNTLYHIAYVRSSNYLYTFVNGIQLGTAVIMNNFGSNSQPVFIGSRPGTPDRFLNGYMDELRISKGIARWTSNFKPPLTQYY